MPNDPWSWLHDARAVVRDRGLVRDPQPVAPGLLDLASNDYLGLSRHPAVVAAAAEAAHRFGAGATGSRLVTGTTTLHLALEQALAEDAEGAHVAVDGGEDPGAHEALPAPARRSSS